MNMSEYEKVKNLTYLEYCNYLQTKYGIGICDYMTPNWSRKNRVSRTQEGLIVHHKYEDKAPNLSNPECAKNYPFEWQQQKNIVYCNYLEHLFLHVLIFEDSIKQNSIGVGVRGITSYLIPELEDYYNGLENQMPWQKKCFELIKDNYNTYTTLVQRFLKYRKLF